MKNTWIIYLTPKYGKQNNSVNNKNKREEIIRIKAKPMKQKREKKPHQ